MTLPKNFWWYITALLAVLLVVLLLTVPSLRENLTGMPRIINKSGN